jgi:hypothetical protein
MTWVRGVLAGPPDIVFRMTEGIQSQLFNIFTTIKLGEISKQDGYKLFVPPLEKHGISSLSEIFESVYCFSGGIPFYLQAI